MRNCSLQGWTAAMPAAGAAAVGGALAAAWTASEALDPRALVVLLVARLVCTRLFRLERLPWGRLGLQDAATAVAALASGSALAGLSAPVLALSLPIPLLVTDTALELSAGAIVEGVRQLRREARAAREAEGRPRALIYGAGERGRALARALLLEPGGRYAPVGFLDDDLEVESSLADGLPVLGPVGALPYAAELLDARVVLCAATRPGERLTDLAEQADVRLIYAPSAVERLEWSGGPLTRPGEPTPAERETESAPV